MNVSVPTLSLSRRTLRALTALLAATMFVAFLRPAPVTAQEAPQRDRTAAQPAKEGESKFVRYQPDPGGGGTLQTSIVRYANDKGAVVDLIGAVHIGDRAYYELLNERFKQYDSLLYEMVKPRDADLARKADDGERPGGGLNLIHLIQKTMQTVLELDYQLEGIDYGAENFVHADMDLETFTRRQSEKGEGFLQMIIKQMFRDMTRPPDPDNPPPSMLEVMDAMNAPDRARRLKLLFARQLANVDDMVGMFADDEGGSVILDERNEAALDVLDARLTAGDDKLGVFYGAAHLKGMEKLLSERGFHPVGEPEWLTAWDMTLDGSGKEQMRQRLRQAIVDEAAADGKLGGAAAVAGADDAGLRALRREVSAVRAESESLRKEVEALREQVQLLREQNAALREQAAER